MAPSPRKQRLIEELTPRLEALGFKKRVELRYTMSLSPDFEGIMAMTTGVHGGCIEVDPWVGVLHLPSARLQAAVAGTTLAKLFSASLGESLNRVSPTAGGPIWAFCDDAASREATMSDMMRHLEGFGIPYIRAHAQVDSLTASLRERYSASVRVRFQLGIVQWVSGDRDEGERVLRDVAAGAEGQSPDSLRGYYGGLARKVLELPAE